MVNAASMPLWKKCAVGVSLLDGVTLVASGGGVRLSPEFFYPPAIWLMGITLLL